MYVRSNIEVELEGLRSKALDYLSKITVTEELVSTFLEITNSALLKINTEGGRIKQQGSVFRIGVTFIDDNGIVAPIKVVRSDAIKKRMYIDTFFMIPLLETSLSPLLKDMKGDYINDMEEHRNRALSKGRISIMSQTCLRENILSNMRFPYDTGRTQGFIFFSGNRKNLFNNTILEFIQELIQSFELALETCTDLDTIIAARAEYIKKKGDLTTNIELLQDIQKKLEPDEHHIFLKNDGIDVYHYSFPWEGKPSGDLLNVWEISSGRYAILIADVSGHGIETAFITIFLNGLFLMEADKENSVEVVMANIDRQLREFIAKRYPGHKYSFATVIFGIYESQTRKFTYCNAGHIPPVVFRKYKDGTELHHLEATNIPIGLPFPEKFQKKTVQFMADDIITFCTDGLGEAKNAESKEFGRERLISILRENSDRVAKDICGSIMERLTKFTGKSSFEDDVTLMVIKIG